ncbi:MAG TPA: 50S ribosomal protein L27 [Bacteroidetes bacterium]|nr:50S ribosomal protein L27 [Bacteroidota bacterium]
MAHKKGEGSTQNGRDSHSKRLGVKLFGGQAARAGNIIIRQRGSRYHLGENVYYGKDWTIHAKVDGTVTYRKGRRNRTFVNILPLGEVAETIAKPAPKPKKEKVVVPIAKTVEAAPAPVAEAPAAPPVEAAPTPPVEEAPVMAAPAPVAKKAVPAAKKDDLKKIEGIGPKIASLLNDAGIFTFAELAATEASKIKEILVAAGSRYGFHNPTTWPEQATMAAEGRWDELKKWQDEHDGGKPNAKAEEE